MYQLYMFIFYIFKEKRQSRVPSRQLIFLLSVSNSSQLFVILFWNYNDLILNEINNILIIFNERKYINILNETVWWVCVKTDWFILYVSIKWDFPKIPGLSLSPTAYTVCKSSFFLVPWVFKSNAKQWEIK